MYGGRLFPTTFFWSIVMNCGNVFGSINAWRKLSGINMKPMLALKILRYTKEVAAEHDAIEKLRLAMVYEITGAKPGQEIRLEPDTEEFKEYVIKLQEILAVETDLKPIKLDFDEVIKSVGEKEESVSISDLAALEPFFVLSVPECSD